MKNKMLKALTITLLLLTTITIIPAVDGDTIFDALNAEDNPSFEAQDFKSTFERVLENFVDGTAVSYTDILDLYGYDPDTGGSLPDTARASLDDDYINKYNIDLLLGCIGGHSPDQSEKEDLLKDVKDDLDDECDSDSQLKSKLEKAISDSEKSNGGCDLSYDDFVDLFGSKGNLDEKWIKLEESGIEDDATLIKIIENLHGGILWVIRDNEGSDNPFFPILPPCRGVVGRLLDKAADVSGKTRDGDGEDSWDTAKLVLQVMWILACAGIGAFPVAQIISMAVGIITAVAVMWLSQ